MDRQELLEYALKELMADVAKTISPKNRDKFTLNLSMFRRNLLQHYPYLIPLTPAPRNPFEVFWQERLLTS
jgi:hypothetical protein